MAKAERMAKVERRFYQDSQKKLCDYTAPQLAMLAVLECQVALLEAENAQLKADVAYQKSKSMFTMDRIGKYDLAYGC